jgi:signal transduction histidine kinase
MTRARATGTGPAGGQAGPGRQEGLRARPTRATGTRDAARRVRDLELVHDLARLATLARDWDELMNTIIERTAVAFGVEGVSFYLLDPSTERLTLAATNGLDPGHVGKVSLAVGEGVTGAAALERRPIEVPDVRLEPRFKWVRGYDLKDLTSMLSVPLTWNDRVVGVLNLQTPSTRRFDQHDVELVTTIAALLAGIVEKGRLQREAETQLETLTALDAARAELLSVVTHELRTPLSVVRAYLDLLAEAGTGAGDVSPRATIDEWHAAAVDQVTRLDRLVDSILASVRGEGLVGLERTPFDVTRAAAETIDLMAPLLRAHRLRWDHGEGPLIAVGDEARFRQVLEHLLENEAKYAPAGWGVSVGAWPLGSEVQVYVTDDGPGVPAEEWERVFDAYVRVRAGGRSGSGIGLYAARRLMDAMGGRVWIEANGYGGSRFIVALPAGGDGPR